ncbi:MAG: urease accessory protein UreD [Alphaproteobacteria bacterium]
MQRGDGAARIVLKQRAGRTELADLYQSDPCRVLFPGPDPGEPFLAVLLTTSGGLAGGDKIEIEVDAGADTISVVSSQSAEKIYRSLGPSTVIRAKLTASPGAWLEWLPHETILFDAARLDRRIEMHVASGARVLAGELIVLGRTARGESFDQGLLHEAWRVMRDDKLVWADVMRLDGDIPALFSNPAGLAGNFAQATVVLAADDAPMYLKAARAALDDCRSKSALTAVNGLLVARFLARDAQLLRREVGLLWLALRRAAGGPAAPLPRVWTN